MAYTKKASGSAYATISLFNPSPPFSFLHHRLIFSHVLVTFWSACATILISLARISRDRPAQKKQKKRGGQDKAFLFTPRQRFDRHVFFVLFILRSFCSYAYFFPSYSYGLNASGRETG
jgi:hypothetical protein